MDSKKKLFFLLVLIIIIISLLLSPLLAVRVVKVVDIGARNINFDQSILDIKSNILLLDTDSIEEDILKTGMVNSATVEKQFFCKLLVNITWKKPIIAIKSDGRYIILSNDGYVLNISNSSEGLGEMDGIIVKSARIGETIITEDDSIFENAVNIYLLMLANKNLYSGEALEPKISIKDNKIINQISEKYIIDFGNGEDYKDKFAKAVSIYNKLLEKGIDTGIINVSRKNNEVYETWK